MKLIPWLVQWSRGGSQLHPPPVLLTAPLVIPAMSPPHAHSETDMCLRMCVFVCVWWEYASLHSSLSSKGARRRLHGHCLLPGKLGQGSDTRLDGWQVAQLHSQPRLQFCQAPCPLVFAEKNAAGPWNLSKAATSLASWARLNRADPSMMCLLNSRSRLCRGKKEAVIGKEGDGQVQETAGQDSLVARCGLGADLSPAGWS